MTQKHLQLENLLETFQSAYQHASSDEQNQLLTMVRSWTEQQLNAKGNLQELTTENGIVKTDTESAHSEPINENFRSQVETENDLSQIMQNIEQACWIQDAQSQEILYVSPAFQTIWGYAKEALYTNPSILIESVHPEDRVQVMAARSQPGQKPYHQAYRILRPNGDLRWISAKIFMIRGKSDGMNFLVCIAQDITDQKQVEFTLRKTLDRTREQFNLSHKMSLSRKPQAVLKTLMSANEFRPAQQAALLYFDNPKFESASGVEITAIWMSNPDLMPWISESNIYEEPALWELFQSERMIVLSKPESDTRFSTPLRDFLTKNQIRTLVIFPLVTSGHRRGCLLISYKQKHHIDHSDLRQLKVLVDQAAITLYNLQLLEIEAESRHEAERANEIKTEFLAMISHELRTPLTSIIGFTTTLLADDVVWDPEEQHDFIQTIQHEADRLQELIDHLLDLSRLEAGMLPIAMEPHTITEIIEDVLPQFKILTHYQTLSLHFPDNLPLVNVDAKRIGQVLVNLVRNASIYAPKETEISLTSIVRANYLQINVSDQGPGIPKNEHKKVFKAFHRGTNIETGLAQGAGLGLAICKGLLEAHGGRIWIRKKNTPGTTISFTIPLVSKDALLKLTEEER
ncbi:MAG: PAS domain-containing protein [Anaerolineaceae bacterium]|nr:PAS domain-containing protein [Anaerolineaceae bacterium]